MTMREKIAEGIGRKLWEQGIWLDPVTLFAVTDAALAALEEPTDAQLDAADKISAIWPEHLERYLEEVWRAMIAAAKDG